MPILVTLKAFNVALTAVGILLTGVVTAIEHIESHRGY